MATSQALSPSFSLALKMHKFVFLLEKLADQSLQQKLRITFSQCMILLSLRENPGCSQQSVAKWRDLTQAAISRQVEMLREKKLLSRRENAKNRREHVIALTPLGAERLAAALKIISKKFEDVFRVLAQEERRAVEPRLDRILTSVCRELKTITPA